MHHDQLQADQPDVINDLINKYFDMTCDQCDDGRFTSLVEAQCHYDERHATAAGYIKCCGRRHADNMLIRGHLLVHTQPQLLR